MQGPGPALGIPTILQTGLTLCWGVQQTVYAVSPGGSWHAAACAGMHHSPRLAVPSCSTEPLCALHVLSATGRTELPSEEEGTLDCGPTQGSVWQTTVCLVQDWQEGLACCGIVGRVHPKSVGHNEQAGRLAC